MHTFFCFIVLPLAGLAALYCGVRWLCPARSISLTAGYTSTITIVNARYVASINGSMKTRPVSATLHGTNSNPHCQRSDPCN